MWQSKRNDIFAGIIIVSAGIIMFYLWYLNPEFRTLYVGESYIDANQFIAGANFKNLGFFKLHLIADYAIGSKEYHPFYYTHNPPLLEIINGIYQKMGLVHIEWQRLVSIIWTLIGFLFFYKMLQLLAEPIVALWSLIIALSNPYILYWGDSLLASHQWLFIYATFYFLLRYIRQPSSLFLFITWLTFFCASFCNYELIPMMIFFVVGLRLLNLEYFSNCNLLIFLSAPLAAFCLRNLLIIWAIGYQNWYCDLIATLLYRTLHIKINFSEIYKHLNVIFWSSNSEIPQRYLWLLLLHLERLYGYGWTIILIVLMFPLARQRLLSAASAIRLFRLILLFFAMGTVWYILFPQHTSEHFHSHAMLMFFPFASLIWSAVLIGSWQNSKYLLTKILCAAGILFAIYLARAINFIPPKPFPGINALHKYEGRVFCTNAAPTIVEYYTKAPAAFCGYEEQFKDLRNGQYRFFLRTNRMPPPTPEFFFSVYGNFEYELAPYFRLIERGPDYSIYSLQIKSNKD